MDEERFLKVYEEIMQCTEAGARCVFMYLSSEKEDGSGTVAGVAQTSF